MDYWGGQRVCWPPLSNYWGGLAPPPPGPPPLPTPMKIVSAFKIVPASNFVIFPYCKTLYKSQKTSKMLNNSCIWLFLITIQHMISAENGPGIHFGICWFDHVLPTLGLIHVLLRLYLSRNVLHLVCLSEIKIYLTPKTVFLAFLLSL